MKTTEVLQRPPAVLLPAGSSTQYIARLANGPEEVRAAQRLRFEVFNLELREGLEGSYATGLDRDRFDEACDHLLAIETQTGTIAGTYRIQTGMSALARFGYYSEQEFDFAPLESLRGEMVEIGRACVDRRHRNLSALGTLWKGIARYACERRARYLVGCSSLPTVDPDAGWNVYQQIAARHLCPAPLRTCPLPGWECPPPSGSQEVHNIPKLLRAYLGLGAVICGEPARDRQFGSIDFLTLLDLDSLAPAARSRFLP